MIPNRTDCTARVWHNTGNWGNYANCSRKATKDGFCFQHHPDALAEKKNKEKALSDRRSKARDDIYSTSETLAVGLAASVDNPDMLDALGAFLRAAVEYHSVKYATDRVAAEILGFALWGPLWGRVKGEETENENAD
jgi:hypothetical protein